MNAHMYYSVGSTGKSLTRLTFTPSADEVIAALHNGALLGDQVRCSTVICGGGSSDCNGNTVVSIHQVARAIEHQYGFSPKIK